MKPRSGAARDAVRRGHRRSTVVRLHTPSGEVGEVPFTDGSLSWSLSRGDGVRSGTLEVPGYDWFAAVEPGRYGWVTVDAGVEGESWDLGQWPITRAVAERPKGTVTLTLGDWTWLRAQPDVEVSATIGSTSQTVAQCVEFYMRDTAPGGVFDVTRDDSNGAAVQSPVELPIGGSVWSALTTVANQVQCVIVVTGRGTGELRNFRAGAEVESLDGAIVSETVAVVADEAVNRVIVVGDQSDPGGDTTTFRAERTLTTGPYAYNISGIGRLALVETVRQPLVSQAVVDAEADRIFERRAGVVRSAALDVVPMPWLEPGDSIGWTSTFVPGRMSGVVNDLTLPLTARGTMRVVLRDGAVR